MIIIYIKILNCCIFCLQPFDDAQPFVLNLSSLSALLHLMQLLDFLESHPYPFIPLIQRSLEFAVSYVFTPVGEGVTFERFIVQCMNLIKMIVKNDAYKPAKNIEGKEAPVREFNSWMKKCRGEWGE